MQLLDPLPILPMNREHGDETAERAATRARHTCVNAW